LEKNVLFFVIVFFSSFILAALVTPIASKIAIRNKIIDKPGLHKTHARPQPLLGGLAIFTGFAATMLLFLDVDEKLVSLVTATLVLLVTGLLDDIYDLKPILKLTGQTAAASIVVLWNDHLFIFMLEYFERFYIPGFIVFVLIIGWIVLMINAFNIIDGLDGLAAGTAAVIFLAMAVLSILTGGNPNILGVQLIGLGACLGFLIFNFHPAKIFMGDTGSMLLGFVLATTHLFTIKYPFSAQLVLGSIFVFAYPALDITFTIFRRLNSHSPLFKADRGHIHHILRSLGLSVRKTVLIIYAVNVFFAVIAIILLGLDIRPYFLLLVGVLMVIGVIVVFRKLLVICEQNGINSDKSQRRLRLRQ
jgi:UDP-GlcNAc:undecaprenyl-phosphate/decaprenyl-phosphate GlcNAc-1-phosphate transferase